MTAYTNGDGPRIGAALLAKLRDDPDGFCQYNELLALFMGGELPLVSLRELLRHPSEPVVAGSLFIAEELGPRASGLADEIIGHVGNKNPRIRISAIEALNGVISEGLECKFASVIAGMRDGDPHCRKIAMLLMIRAPEEWLHESLRSLEAHDCDPALRAGLEELVGATGRDVNWIEKSLASDDPLVRRFGVVAAGRYATTDQRLLEVAALSQYPDVQMCAAAQIKFLSMNRRARQGRS